MEKTIWAGWRQLIDLGDEALVKRLPARAPVAGDTLSVPQALLIRSQTPEAVTPEALRLRPRRRGGVSQDFR